MGFCFFFLHGVLLSIWKRRWHEWGFVACLSLVVIVFYRHRCGACLYCTLTIALVNKGSQRQNTGQYQVSHYHEREYVNNRTGGFTDTASLLCSAVKGSDRNFSQSIKYWSLHINCRPGKVCYNQHAQDLSHTDFCCLSGLWMGLKNSMSPSPFQMRRRACKCTRSLALQASTPTGAAAEPCSISYQDTCRNKTRASSRSTMWVYSISMAEC